MDDLISRQAAIKAICEDGTWLESQGCTEITMAERKQRDADILSDLPSAQTESCGDVVSRNAIVQKLNKMDRYVSAELRLCDTDKKFPQNEVFIVDDVYEEIVEQLPSAQPEPHYCRECKWSWCYIKVDKHGNSETYWWCRNWDGETDKEGYCYEWERKEE